MRITPCTYLTLWGKISVLPFRAVGSRLSRLKMWTRVNSRYEGKLISGGLHIFDWKKFYFYTKTVGNSRSLFHQSTCLFSPGI